MKMVIVHFLAMHAHIMTLLGKYKYTVIFKIILNTFLYCLVYFFDAMECHDTVIVVFCTNDPRFRNTVAEYHMSNKRRRNY